MTADAFDAVTQVNAEWVAITPYAYTGGQGSDLNYSINWQWWGEREEGAEACVRMAHSKGLNVMMKPHVWIRHGTFTGDYNPGNDQAWKRFEQQYENYIMAFVAIAARNQVAAFCIGTEWKVFVKERPEFWSQLIDKVRANYQGKLTYAGNWDSYKDFPHWDKLDYIGIDAYFPVAEAQVPSVQDFEDGWKHHFDGIKAQAEKWDRPVIFTEYGFRSMEYNGQSPWDSGRGNDVSLEAQANAYEALFNTFWDVKWFHGGFVWKWFPDHASAGGENHNKFTPQNKPAEQTLRQWYGR